MYEGDGTVTLVAVNRPKKCNALSLERMRELTSCSGQRPR